MRSQNRTLLVRAASTSPPPLVESLTLVAVADVDTDDDADVDDKCFDVGLAELEDDDDYEEPSVKKTKEAAKRSFPIGPNVGQKPKKLKQVRFGSALFRPFEGFLLRPYNGNRLYSEDSFSSKATFSRTFSGHALF